MIEEIEKEYEYMIKISGKFPKKIKMSKAKYKNLVEECLETDIENSKIFDKNGNAVAPFIGMKIVIDNKIQNFVIE